MSNSIPPDVEGKRCGLLWLGRPHDDTPKAVACIDLLQAMVCDVACAPDLQRKAGRG